MPTQVPTYSCRFFVLEFAMLVNQMNLHLNLTPLERALVGLSPTVIYRLVKDLVRIVWIKNSGFKCRRNR
jgi:hypothetical protein